MFVSGSLTLLGEFERGVHRYAVYHVNIGASPLCSRAYGASSPLYHASPLRGSGAQAKAFAPRTATLFDDYCAAVEAVSTHALHTNPL